MIDPTLRIVVAPVQSSELQVSTRYPGTLWLVANNVSDRSVGYARAHNSRVFLIFMKLETTTSFIR